MYITNGIYILYITEGDVIPYNNYLAENLSSFLSNPDTNNEEKEEAVSNLINLTRLDFTTYNHSMNVGIFATGLMKALFSDDDTHNLEELAVGFFLHDLGKSTIPLKILKEQMKNDFDPIFFKKFVLLFTDKLVKQKYA